MTCSSESGVGEPATAAGPDQDRPARRLFLVGPMAAGKTTLGRQLARRLGLDFIDTDREIEARAGVDIATIFDFEGEAGFRTRESRIIDELTRRDDIVLATGGGAVLAAENRQHLHERGLVIHLSIPVEEQLRRTRRDRSRPLLQNTDRRATLTQLAEQRDPLYRSVAHITIETEGRRSRHTLERVLERLPAPFR